MPEEGRFGIIVGYNVSYTKHDEPSGLKYAACSNISWCEIKGLDLSTRYYINVTGATVKGSGPSAYVEAQTDKGGKVSSN